MHQQMSKTQEICDLHLVSVASGESEEVCGQTNLKQISFFHI